MLSLLTFNCQLTVIPLQYSTDNTANNGTQKSMRNDNVCLLGCDAGLGVWFPTFRWSVLPEFLRFKWTKKKCLRITTLPVESPCIACRTQYCGAWLQDASVPWSHCAGFSRCQDNLLGVVFVSFPTCQSQEVACGVTAGCQNQSGLIEISFTYPCKKTLSVPRTPVFTTPY
jgi:hypothetical protein